MVHYRVGGNENIEALSLKGPHLNFIVFNELLLDQLLVEQLKSIGIRKKNFRICRFPEAGPFAQPEQFHAGGVDVQKFPVPVANKNHIPAFFEQGSEFGFGLTGFLEQPGIGNGQRNVIGKQLNQLKLFLVEGRVG